MYVGRDFLPMNPDESQVLSLDFTNDLPPGDSIISADVSLTVYTGTDATPSSHLDGSVGISGATVSQRISDLLPGVVYTLIATATTTQTNILTLWSRVACFTPK